MAVLTVFALSFVLALSGALIPGPLLTVTIAQTARRGFLASVFIVLGHSLLELLLVLGLVFGLGHFMKLHAVQGTVTVLGGVMLIWMGFNMIRDARRGVLDIDTSAQDGGSANTGILGSLVITGIAVSITNPYFTIWWSTVGLTFFAALPQNSIAAIVAFYFGHILGDIVWYVSVGAAVSTGRRLINPVVYRVIVVICGVFLVFLGGSFLYLIVTGDLWKINMSINLEAQKEHMLDSLRRLLR